ncbi:hypothetical protein ACFL2V_17950 [Pseudomonadota bacterium]
MSLWGTIGFTLLALCMGFMGFLMAAFGGGAAANTPTINKFGMWILDLSILVLPASSIISVIGLWYAYSHDYAQVYYSWAVLPVGLIVLYMLFLYFYLDFR